MLSLVLGLDTRNRPIAVLDAIFFVDMNVHQTKHDAFEQALINWQLHASLFFKWGKTLALEGL